MQTSVLPIDNDKIVGKFLTGPGQRPGWGFKGANGPLKLKIFKKFLNSTSTDPVTALTQ